MVSEEIRLLLVALVVVGVVTVLLHERHYQSRRERILLGRIQVLEDIIGENRGT